MSGLKFEKLSALVIEDTDPMRLLITAILEKMGVKKILNAENGERDFAVFCRQNPDIIITDWHMSPINGIDFTRKIRISSHSPNRMVPIIMTTGYNANTRIAASRDAGITEYLSKPFTAEDMVKRIAHVIKSPRDFILSDTFQGPDRRRKNIAAFKGPFRRNDEINSIKTI